MISKKTGEEIPLASKAIPEFWGRFEQCFNLEKPDWKGLEALFEPLSLFSFHYKKIHKSAAGPGPIIKLLKYLRRYLELQTFHVQGSFSPDSIQDTEWLAGMKIGEGPETQFDLRTDCHSRTVKIGIEKRRCSFIMVGIFVHHEECLRVPFSVFFIR
jgi:hypothetical protein